MHIWKGYLMHIRSTEHHSHPHIEIGDLFQRIFISSMFLISQMFTAQTFKYFTIEKLKT